MITYGEVLNALASIQDLEPESMVELEEDMADGFVIVRVPVSFAFKGASADELVYFYDETYEDR